MHTRAIFADPSVPGRSSPLDDVVWLVAGAVVGALGGVLVARTGASAAVVTVLALAGVLAGIAIMRDPRTGLFAMLIALPLDVAGRIATQPVTVTVYHVTLLITLASWFRARRLRPQGPWQIEYTVVHLGLLALLVAALWSLPFSYDPSATVIAFVRLAFISLFFAVAASLLGERRTADRALALLAATSAVSACVALVQYAFPGLGIGTVRTLGTSLDPVSRPAAFFHDPNYLATFLSLGVIVSVARAVHLRRLRAALPWLLAALVSAAGLGVTLSRTGFVGLAAGLVVCVLTAPRGRRNVLLLALVATVVAVTVVAPGLVVERVKSLGDVTSDRSMMTRYYMAGSTLRIARDHWVTGTGLGAYERVYPAYRHPYARPDIMQPHELVFSPVAEMGVMGLVAQVLIVGGVLAEVASRRRRGWGTWQSAGVAGLAAILVQSLFQYYLYFEYLWLFLALTVAATRHAPAAEEV